MLLMYQWLQKIPGDNAGVQTNKGKIEANSQIEKSMQKK